MYSRFSVNPVVFPVALCCALIIGKGHAQSDVDGINDAIARYQSGDGGDVIRYLMQQGYEGSVPAQFNLGVINYQRDDQSVGLKEANFWFAEAAEEGDLVAQMNLGILNIDAATDNGDSALLDQGVSWLRRSAESGYVPAQVNLGGLMVAGKISPRVDNEGKAWLRVAASAGDPRASQLLALVASEADDKPYLSYLYPIDLQLRSEIYRGGSRVSNEEARIYSRPEDGIDPIATIRAGAMVEVVDRQQGWVSVKVPAGLPVWMAASAADIEGELARVNRLEVPLYTAAEADDGDPGIGTVTKGESLALLQQRGDWLQVLSPERFAGWMQQRDIASRIDAELVAFQQRQQEQSAATVASAETQPELMTAALRLITDAKLLQTPERDSVLLGVVAGDTKIAALEQQGEYIFADNVMVSGWVSNSLLKQEVNPETGLTEVIGLTDSARIRSRPDLASDIFGLLPRGESKRLIEQSEDWARIEIGSGSGWIVSRLLQPDELVTDAAVANIAATENPEDEQNQQLQAGLSETAGDTEPVTQVAETAVELNDELAQESAAEVAPESTDNLSAQPAVSDGVEDPAPQLVADDSQTETFKADAVLYVSDSTASPPLGRLMEALAKPPIRPESQMFETAEPVAVYGWIFASLVSRQGQDVVVEKDSVRIRLDPTTTQNNIVTARNRGDRMRFLGQDNGWFQVALEPVSGWLPITDSE